MALKSFLAFEEPCFIWPRPAFAQTYGGKWKKCAKIPWSSVFTSGRISWHHTFPSLDFASASNTTARPYTTKIRGMNFWKWETTTLKVFTRENVHSAMSSLSCIGAQQCYSHFAYQTFKFWMTIMFPRDFVNIFVWVSNWASQVQNLTLHLTYFRARKMSYLLLTLDLILVVVVNKKAYFMQFHF